MLSGSKAAYDEATQRRDQMEQINQSINVSLSLYYNRENKNILYKYNYKIIKY